MGFFGRLVSQRIAELELLLTAAQESSANWHDSYQDMKAERDALLTRLAAETSENREHEALLVSAALQVAGVGGIPTQKALAEPTPDEDPEPKLNDAQETTLRVRALEIAGQTYGAGLTDEQIEATYKRLLKNPEYWLSN